LRLFCWRLRPWLNPSEKKTGVNSTLGISPTTADFVKEAATSDMFEIQSSQIAQERGNATEKVFAETMIKDQDLG